MHVGHGNADLQDWHAWILAVVVATSAGSVSRSDISPCPKANGLMNLKIEYVDAVLRHDYGLLLSELVRANPN